MQFRGTRSLSVKLFALDPVESNQIPTWYALKQGSQLLIASVDSAVNEYQPSGRGGALRQTDVLVRGGVATPKSLHVIETGISSCRIPH